MISAPSSSFCCNCYESVSYFRHCLHEKNSTSIAVDKVVLLQRSPRKIFHLLTFQFVRGAADVGDIALSVKRVRRQLQLGTVGLLLHLPSTAAAGCTSVGP